MTYDGIRGPEFLDQPRREHFGTGAMLGFGRQNESRIIHIKCVILAVMMVDPGHQTVTKRFDEFARVSLKTAAPTAALGGKGDIKNGDRLWQLRLKGPFSATPVAAGKYLYCFNEAGLLQVVDTTAKEGKIVGKFNLNDQILGSPAVGGGAIYVRTNTKIYKLAK